jgi:hypothetical protein
VSIKENIEEEKRRYYLRPAVSLEAAEIPPHNINTQPKPNIDLMGQPKIWA